MRRAGGFVTTALLGAALGGLAASAHAQEAGAPTGRGLLGGVVQQTTTTLDGALQSVSAAAGGAVALPSTADLTTTVTGTVDGTVQVVAGTVEQVTAPVTEALAGPQASVSLPGLATVDGAAVLDLVVGNVGTAACSPIASLGISGKNGISVAGGVTQLLSIPPGASREYVLPWPTGLAAGTYDIAASVSGCGDLQALTLSVTVGAPAPEGRVNPGDGADGSGGAGGGGAGGGAGASAGSAGSAAGGSGSAGSSAPTGSSNSSQSGSGSGPQAAATSAATRTGDAVAADRRAVGSPGTRDRGRPGSLATSAVAGPPAPVGLLNDPEQTASKLPGAKGVVSGAVSGPRQSTFGETASAVVRAVPAVLERAAPALAILGLIGALFLVQEALAKRDPKLALAPIGPVDDLDFDEPATFLRHFAEPPPPRGSA